jgi:hypothetical protein
MPSRLARLLHVLSSPQPNLASVNPYISPENRTGLVRFHQGGDYHSQLAFRQRLTTTLAANSPYVWELFFAFFQIRASKQCKSLSHYMLSDGFEFFLFRGTPIALRDAGQKRRPQCCGESAHGDMWHVPEV